MNKHRMKAGLGALALMTLAGCQPPEVSSFGEESPANGTTRVSPLTESGDQADFVITSVTGPKSVEPGQTLTAQVTVCNQGSRSGTTRVALLLSEDEHPRVPSTTEPPEDLLLGDAPVTSLAAGQCTTVSISGTAQRPPSAPAYAWGWALHLGAVVDPDGSTPELHEDNNAYPGEFLGLGVAADFVITSVTGPAVMEFGQPITPQVTVCNQGNAVDYARVLFLVSEDERFDLPSSSGPGDFMLGTPVSTSIPSGTCATLSSTGSVPPVFPPDTRTLHVGAVLDTSNVFEILKDNNTHPGYVARVAAGADFVITSVTGPESARLHHPLSAEVTVCNQGTRVMSTHVLLLLSEDEHLQVPFSGPLEDALVGDAWVPPLAPGGCTTVSTYGPVILPPMGSPDTRTFRLGAVVDPHGDIPELLEDNNSLLGGWIHITP
ncbi:hypothetical protein CYFUS_006183 [Cystobacter fuscus]|uniref:CARDB domain-containing protein n=1 Tax=Cystobacter fuscus TaxID=43 RepID=A0A250JB38_9BACT|nr:CARDB domain-containing protein [Cystobacter fuscus]ATB40727.1 hypothetical protein CYFUS_006183 [Cystobacter fuscus]